MWMYGCGNVARGSPHFHCEHALADQLPGADPGDTDAENAFGLRLNDQLSQTVGSVQSQRAARRAPEKLCHADFDAILLSLHVGEAAPGHFRIGVNYGRNHDVFKRALFLQYRLHSDARLAGGAVREQGSSINVSYGIDIRVLRLLLRVTLDETFVVLRYFRILQPEIAIVWRAANAHEHSVIELIALIF